jgi:hypothetical protein
MNVHLWSRNQPQYQGEAGGDGRDFHKNAMKQSADSVRLRGWLSPCPSETVGTLILSPPENYDLWLNPEIKDFDAVREILKPYDPSLMWHYP